MAKECPNDTKKHNCILCGKDTHESFDCTEKMCFKCNKVGHQARDCTEKVIVQCQKCNHVGHREQRCLKEWSEPSSKVLKHIVCIQCGNKGHIKCTSEYQSKLIKIDAKVMNDLNEFVHTTFREAELSDSEEESRRQSLVNPEFQDDVDAFDYVNSNIPTKKKKQKKAKKLSKSQKR